jgi:hypothetical protein
VDWQQRTVDDYRRVDDALQFVGTLAGDAVLESPLLPGFTLPITWLSPPTR